MTDEWREVADRIRNWGKWGDEDQLGTLNYITPEHVARAAALVKQGKHISLGAAIDSYGPQGKSGARRNPVHLMTVHGGDEDLVENLGGWGGEDEDVLKMLFAGPMRYTDDYIIMPTQGSSHWDALAHVYYDGKLYNGYPARAVTGRGATRDSIDAPARAAHTVARGVLLDVARHRGLDRLEPSTAIMPEELDEVAAKQGVEIGEGDIPVVRTGWWTKFLEDHDETAWQYGSPGLSWRCAEWLHDRRCAAVACDNIAVEVLPPETDTFLLFHMLVLRDMGLMMGQIWALEELGRDCAEDGVYEFMLVAPALPISGGVGTPVNPIALK